MCRICQRRAVNSAELAQYFRDKARDTRLTVYIALMTEAAESLDEVTAFFHERCQCDNPALASAMARWAEPAELRLPALSAALRCGLDDRGKPTQRAIQARRICG